MKSLERTITLCTVGRRRAGGDGRRGPGQDNQVDRGRCGRRRSLRQSR